MDVTDQVRAAISNNKYELKALWEFQPDPVPNKVKKIWIEYSYETLEKTVIFSQRQDVSIP
jgi:hypothetical protein